LTKIEEIILKSYQDQDSLGYSKTQIELLKLNHNPNIYFQNIIEKTENQELDLSKLDKNNMTDEDFKLLETILEYDEKITQIEKENIFLKQNIDKEKSKFSDLCSKLSYCQSDVDEAFEKLIDNQEAKKIILLHWLSLVKIDKMVSFNSKSEIDAINNEWGKVLFLTEILIRLLIENLVDYTIFPLGVNSYFLINNEIYHLSKLTKNDFYIKSREVLNQYFKILKKFDSNLPYFDDIFSIEKYCFVKCVEYIINILSDIINKI
jgi:hypothetical protein